MPPRILTPWLTPELLARFHARVDTSGGPGACWPWTPPAKKGYGQISTEPNVLLLTHRIAYALRYGEPGALHVCHRCDNPPCCNPEHLFLGTLPDNYYDCVKKRRHTHGQRHPRAKLTDEQVREIRRLRALGARPVVLAAGFGVSQHTVSSICTLRSWKHLT